MFTYHCTVLHGLIGNPGAWLQTHKPAASHFSRSTLCFGGVSLVVLAKKVNTGRQFFSDSGEQKFGARRAFFSFFPVFLPLRVRLFWIVFSGFVQSSWTRSRRGWVFGTGLVSAFTFTVWLTAALRLPPTSIKQDVVQERGFWWTLFKIKAPLVLRKTRYKRVTLVQG